MSLPRSDLILVYKNEMDPIKLSCINKGLQITPALHYTFMDNIESKAWRDVNFILFHSVGAARGRLFSRGRGT